MITLRLSAAHVRSGAARYSRFICFARCRRVHCAHDFTVARMPRHARYDDLLFCSIFDATHVASACSLFVADDAAFRCLILLPLSILRR